MRWWFWFFGILSLRVTTFSVKENPPQKHIPRRSPPPTDTHRENDNNDNITKQTGDALLGGLLCLLCSIICLYHHFVYLSVVVCGFCVLGWVVSLRSDAHGPNTSTVSLSSIYRPATRNPKSMYFGLGEAIWQSKVECKRTLKIQTKVCNTSIDTILIFKNIK